jgi:hypothetical protein
MRWYLRITVSVLSLAICVSLVCLWLRSYHSKDYVTGPLPGTRSWGLLSHRGKLVLAIHNYKMPWSFHPKSVEDLGFDQLTLFRPRPPLPGIVLPYWLFVFSSGILALIPWVEHVKWRFSVRTLLIAITMVAVALGLVVLLK